MSSELLAPPSALGDGAIDYAGLIQEDRVHGSLYTEQRVFEDEMRRLWRREWIYAGHESEVPEPGDYRRRFLAGVDCVLTRDEDGRVHVLVNRCPHRGNLVCTAEAGNSRVLRCAYHGWAFKNDGSLLGLTFRDAYTAEHGKQDKNLASVPNVEIYRGLIFVRFAESGTPFDEHIAPVRPYLDRYLDRSPTGRIRVVAEMKVKVSANWKIALDNTVDGYHPKFVHQATFYQQRPEVGKTSDAAARGKSRGARAIDLGRGCAQIEWGEARVAEGAGRIPLPEPWQAEYERALHANLGESRARTVLDNPVPHVLVFPNLFVLQNDLRVFIPIGPRVTLYHTYFWEMEDVRPEVNQLRLRQHEQLYSPASGFVISDDFDIFERMQLGLEARFDSGQEWLDQSRGMHREEVQGDQIRGMTVDEVGVRGIWRHYRSVMTSGAVS